jgi:excisionase family DNA binding protein
VRRDSGSWSPTDHHNMDPQEFLSVKQAADEKGVTTKSIYRALTEGRLDGKRLGSVWLVSRVSLLAWQPRNVPLGPGARKKGSGPGGPSDTP